MKFTFHLMAMVVAIWSCTAIAAPLKVDVIDISPWGYRGKDGKPAGQHIEMFDALSKRSGIPFEYSLVPLERVKVHLKVGKADMTVIFHREEMADYVEFIGLVMPYNYYLVGKKGVLFDKQTLKSVQSVGFARGEEDVAKKCFTDKFASKAKMRPVDDYGVLLKMVAADRFDAVTIPSKGLKAYLDKIGADQSLIGRLFVLCRNEAYLQFSRKSPQFSPVIIEKLQTALRAMRKDGTIEKIAAKYAEVK